MIEVIDRSDIALLIFSTKELPSPRVVQDYFSLILMLCTVCVVLRIFAIHMGRSLLLAKC